MRSLRGEFSCLQTRWTIQAVASSGVVNLVTRVRGGPLEMVAARMAAQSGSYYGMLLAHCGVAVFIVGVTLVKGYESELDVRMEIGESVAAAGYDIRFDGVKDVQGPNYVAARGTLRNAASARRVIRCSLPD